jgi:twitching motility protein PilT
MAQLDRLLSALVSNNGTALVLADGEVATLTTRDATRALMNDPLTTAQIRSLMREVAPGDALSLLDAGGSPRFDYVTAAGKFDIAVNQKGAKLAARIEPRPAAVITDGKGQPVVRASPGVASGISTRALERIEALLRKIVTSEASDLHLRADAPPMLRASGTIKGIPGEAAIPGEEIDAMLSAVMLEKNRAEFAALSDTDFVHEITGIGRFRGNAFRDRKGTGAVFRSIPMSVVTVEAMGLSAEVQRLCHLTKGLVLVTGPTGSGKSTTLCALIDLINRTRTEHIITIEDPIEFVHENKKCLITQRQVGVHTSSFAHALRAAMREDPDIVLVGELRDLETMSMAIETAETGHLVFGTVHTSSAVGTVDRVIDQFPADRQSQIRMMLSESLKGVISQVLCKRIGGGRVAAREVMLAAPAVSNLIREGKTFQLPSVLQTSRKLGMVTMNDALIDLVDTSQVEPQEAYFKAIDKVGILHMLKQRGKNIAFADALDAMPAKDASEGEGPSRTWARTITKPPGR